MNFGKKRIPIQTIDGIIFSKESEKTTKGINVISGFILNNIVNGIINKTDCFIAQKDGLNAHGETVKSAINDLQFKIVSEKLKKDPIYMTTMITVNHYRLLTGACDSGCRNWMSNNGIEFIIENKGTPQERTVEKEPISVEELLPILERTNAYGVQKFKSLIKIKWKWLK
ncbi:hypothetical protein A9508_00155 [Mycoplasmopsis bovis]|nr:hypothetical protein A9508_00155 [Mycoplasmopsis bovis]